MERRKTPPEPVNWTAGIMALSLVAILGAMTWALVYVEMPSANSTVLSVLIGILGTQVNTVVNYYFGSSNEAKKKNDTIDTLAKTAHTAGTALASNTASATDALVIPEGGSATATATPNGTVITTDEDVKQ